MKSKIIQLLKSADDYISGEEMSKIFGVSRTAIWKVITHLKGQGYIIESVTNKGYYLKSSPDLLTEEEIIYDLKTRYIGKKVYHYDKIDSTNKEAKKLASKGEKEGIVVVAEEQLLGKGRLGRTWSSPTGVGIWMSIILRPEISPIDASKVTLIAGLAVCRGIESVTGLKSQIKWPNDIIINNKKVCGILTEMSAEIEKINYIILGIGMNVNTYSFPEDIMNKATSLKIEGKKNYDRKDILQQILVEFEKNYDDFIKNNNMDKVLREYKRNCLTLGKDVKIIERAGEFTGKALDVSKEGELIVQKENGEMVTVLSGEVSVRGMYGYI
ncbi:MAG: biotin--[acetyl-CoA-carboxylase] ligase [Epulopiscium sp.]|nr:biotin--[acetyl-CoA-carboxylase] ligase [Candidatus Epulonipiscium sp.]